MILTTSSIFLFLIAKLMKDSPQKEINNFIVYRSKRSMKSKKNWDISQVYSMKLMHAIFFKTFLFSLPLLIIDIFLIFNNENIFLVSLTIQTIILFSLFYLVFKKTENKLKIDGD